MTRNKIIVVFIIAVCIICIGIYGVNKGKISYNESSSNEKNNEETIDDEKIGTYSKVEISEKEVAERYYSEIQELILKDDYYSLDLIIDRTGKYSTFNSEQIKDEVYYMGFMGEELEIVDYKKEEDNNWNNVYVFNTKIKEDGTQFIITIKESSPNNYVVSFE